MSALGLVLLLAPKSQPVRAGGGPLGQAPASARTTAPQLPESPVPGLAVERDARAPIPASGLNPTSDAAQGTGANPAGTTAPMNPNLDFENAPGVLSISLRTRRREALNAYSSEALGVIALGLEDLRLAPSSRDGRLTANLGELLRYEQKEHEVPKQSRRLLDGVARLLSENLETRVEILSHTDDDGDAGFNLRLSQRRAEALKAYLVERGIAPERISAQGRGENDPLIDTGRRTPTRIERAKNRRTELIIVALDTAKEGGSR